MIAYAGTGFLVLLGSKPVFLLTPFIETVFENALQLAVFNELSTLAEVRLIQESLAQHQATIVPSPRSPCAS